MDIRFESRNKIKETHQLAASIGYLEIVIQGRPFGVAFAENLALKQGIVSEA
jgi:hypothetical protein